MNDDEYEIHPLDRDYSDDLNPAKPRKKTPLGDYHPKLRYGGTVVFAAGFAFALLGAVLSSNGATNSPMESIGSTVHHLGMITILVGGVLVVIAYRIHQIKKLFAASAGDTRSLRRSGVRLKGFRALVIANVLFFAGLWIAIEIIMSMRSPFAFFLLQSFFVVLFSLLVTMTIWNRGFVRAFAVGVMTAAFVSLFVQWFGMGIYSGLYGRGGGMEWVLGAFAVIQISGLVSAGYANFIESMREKSDED